MGKKATHFQFTTVFSALAIIALLVLSSCIGHETKKAISMKQADNTLVFQNPPLSIHLKNTVESITQEETTRKVLYADKTASPLFIEFIPKSKLSLLDLHYDLKYIVESNRFIYIGPAYFNDEEWARVAHVDVEGYLLYGYFTLKDEYFIYVYMIDGLNQNGINSFMRYKNTRKLPDRARRFLGKKFKNFHLYADIEY